MGAACSSSQDEDITSATTAVAAPPLHPEECGKKEVIHGSARTFMSVCLGDLYSVVFNYNGNDFVMEDLQ